jgi:streptomycin 6-kinase
MLTAKELLDEVLPLIAEVLDVYEKPDDVPIARDSTIASLRQWYDKVSVVAPNRVDAASAWISFPDCPRCGKTLIKTEGHEYSIHGEWYCDHLLEGKRIWWNYELTEILRQRAAKNVPYGVQRLRQQRRRRVAR